MTDPNTPTHTDILAARERVKAKIHPAHHGDIDAGKFDPWALVQGELRDMIRERKGEEVVDG
jgi:hypothetical protein